MVDTLVLGTSAERRVGSSPTEGTNGLVVQLEWDTTALEAVP